MDGPEEDRGMTGSLTEALRRSELEIVKVLLDWDPNAWLAYLLCRFGVTDESGRRWTVLPNVLAGPLKAAGIGADLQTVERVFFRFNNIVGSMWGYVREHIDGRLSSDELQKKLVELAEEFLWFWRIERASSKFSDSVAQSLARNFKDEDVVKRLLMEAVQEFQDVVIENVENKQRADLLTYIGPV